MASDLIYGVLYNADSVAWSNGMLLRVSGTNRAVRAQADSAGHLQGLAGVNISGIIGIGGSANVCLAGASQPVLCETGLTISPGETLYVSTVAGRATNVAPGIPVAIGTVEDTAAYSRNSTVRAVVSIPATTTASGGGSVNVTGDDGITVDNSTPTNPIVKITDFPSTFRRRGADLPDADTTYNPAANQASVAVLPTLTDNRQLILGVSLMPPFPVEFNVVRTSLSAFTYEVIDGGPGGLSLLTFPASPLTSQSARFSWNGTNFSLVDFYYSPGTAFAPPTNPLFLSPLVWLRADLGVTLIAGKCSAWADQSGNSNDAAQTTVGNRFTFNASSIGGRPGMTGLAGTGMNLASGVFTAGQQRWLVAVVKATAGNGGVVFEARTVAPTWTVAAGNLGSADFGVYSDLSSRTLSTSPAYAYDGAGHVMQYASTVGAPIGFAIDGAAQTLVNTFGADPNVISDTGGSPAARIGFSFIPGIGFIGDIAEIIAGAGTISASDQFKLSAYLTNRYGIVLP